jgi:TrmH family RNA methyltransferase
MLSKKQVSRIVSLQKKKSRDEEKLFVIEGDKIVKEFLSSGTKVVTLLAKPEFISGLTSSMVSCAGEVIPVSYEELKKLSSLRTPHNAIAVVRMTDTFPDSETILNDLCVALDFVQDPGNLGTIIRAAAWFGIKNIVCSENCVDAYNSKVIQASMGAILNVTVKYCLLSDFLTIASEKKVPVYGTLLDGRSIYSEETGTRGVILLGNESKGISHDLMPFITNKISIPKFTEASHGIESLNVGMAASVIFSEFARRRNRSF